MLKMNRYSLYLHVARAIKVRQSRVNVRICQSCFSSSLDTNSRVSQADLRIKKQVISCREKTGFFLQCENKDADQLRGNREADQRLCFRYIDSTIPLLSKSET